MCEDEDSEMGEEERETSRSRTHDYGPVPRGGRRASSRTRGTSYDAVLGEPTAGAHGQKSSKWRYKRVIRNHGQGNARSISRGAARDSRSRGQNKEQCDRDVSFAETELYPGPNSFTDEPEGANEMPVDTDDNRDMTAARDESNNRNKMASDVRAEVSHRMPNGLTHESEAYQQPLSQADDMTVDGEYIQVDYNPMKNGEQGCESEADGATRREQEILEQTRKCIAEKDELMHNTATAIRVEAAQAVAVHHEALRIEFEENKERMKAALAAEAAEEIRIAAENSHRAREQALLEKALADEARAEQARVIKAAEKMRLEAQTEVNAAGLEARVARAERDREAARADHILHEAQSQVARTTQQLKQAEEARAADCAKLEEVKREAHRRIREETDVASAAGKAVASAEHRSQRMADEARVLERQKRLAEDRRAEAERVAKDAAVTTKAHEQAIKHAVMVKEAGHAQELAAMKACAAEAEARSMKLVQELRKREESASRSAERESKNPSANAELIKEMREMKAAATAAAEAASAAQEASRKMTEEAQLNREEVKRWISEIDEKRSLRSSRLSSTKGSKAATSVESALSDLDRRKMSTTELLRRVIPENGAVLNLAGDPVHDSHARRGTPVSVPSDLGNVAADDAGKARPVVATSGEGGCAAAIHPTRASDGVAQGQGTYEAACSGTRSIMNPYASAGNKVPNGGCVNMKDGRPPIQSGGYRRGRSTEPRSDDGKEGSSYDYYGGRQIPTNAKSNNRHDVRARSERCAPIASSCDPGQVPSSEPAWSRPPIKAAGQARPPSYPKCELSRGGGRPDLVQDSTVGVTFDASYKHHRSDVTPHPAHYGNREAGNEAQSGGTRASRLDYGEETTVTEGKARIPSESAVGQGSTRMWHQQMHPEAPTNATANPANAPPSVGEVFSGGVLVWMSLLPPWPQPLETCWMHGALSREEHESTSGRKRHHSRKSVGIVMSYPEPKRQRAKP